MIKISKEFIKKELLDMSFLIKAIITGVAGSAYMLSNPKVAFGVMIVGAVADHIIHRISAK